MRYLRHITASVSTTIFVLLLANCGGGRGTGSQQVPGPVINFVQPTEGSTVHGTVNVQVTAYGVGKLSTLKFTAPSALTSATPTLDGSQNSGTLSATLDVSTLPDGPLTISVAAEDQLGGKTTADLHVMVSQKAPSITVGSPVDGTTIKGTVNIIANARPQGDASIVSLTLVDPPPGVQADGLPAADSYLAAFDTTLAPEGNCLLHFRATDSSGLSTDLTIVPIVDNKPASVIDTWVYAGAPVVGAVVDAYAIDNATGAVVTSAGASGIIGTSAATDPAGHAKITVQDENWSGPVQLVARPATTGASLTYADPSFANSPITIPASLSLTGLIPNYASGSNYVAPVSLYTTLADAEVFTYAAGHHRKHPGTTTIVAASSYASTLFEQHLKPLAPRWSLRTTIPASLTDAASTLNDQDYAAFVDVALNRLARDLGAAAQASSVVTAPYLVQLLIGDLEADGQFDGLGESRAQIYTSGMTPQKIDANTMRNALGVALSEFLSSDRNGSGISRSDVDGAGVFSAMSTDTSELFPDDQAPTSFDSTPPAVTWTVRYGATSATPYGTAHYVSGALAISATARDDSSGMGGLSIRVGSTPLSASVTHNSDGSWTATAAFDTATVSDGALTLYATATDVRSNTATSSYSLIVDNTAPTASFAAPSSSARYSISVPFDVTAVDSGAGVASLSAFGLEGITDADSAANHLFAAWTVPSRLTDGPLTSAGLTTCDNVSNCRSYTLGQAGAPTVTIDRTPPTISWVTSPPDATRADNLQLTVQATDPAGVSAVSGTIDGTLVQFDSTSTAGQYTYKATLTPNASTVIRVWAVDNATSAASGAGSNSGQMAGAPYHLAAQIIQDSTPEAASVDANFVSYYPENAMVPLLDGAGNAAVPFVPNYGSTARVSVGATQVVYKTAPRLGYVAAPSVAELEDTTPTGNPGNWPVLRFTTGASASAIVSAQYSMQATCSSGCPGGTFTGPLMRGSQANTYLLPLTTNTLSALATGVGAITVSVDVDILDAAGNHGHLPAPFQLVYHVLGGAVAVHEDMSFPTVSATDPRSTYAYHVTDNGYAKLFDASVFAAEGGVRLARYIVTNPSTTPVAYKPLLQGAFSTVSETWIGDGAQVGTANYTDYGSGSQPCANARTFGDWYITSGLKRYTPGCMSGTPTDASYATGTWNGVYRYSMVVTAGGTSFVVPTCTDTSSDSVHLGTPPDANPSAVAAPLKLVAYQAAYPGAYSADGPSAQALPDGSYVVPAATAQSPGALLIYVLRDSSVPRSLSAPALTWTSGLYGSDTNPSWERPAWQTTRPADMSTSATRSNTANTWVRGSTCSCTGSTCYLWSAPVYTWPWVTWQYVQRLRASSESVMYSITQTTTPFSGTTLLGENSSYPSAVKTATINH